MNVPTVSIDHVPAPSDAPSDPAIFDQMFAAAMAHAPVSTDPETIDDGGTDPETAELDSLVAAPGDMFDLGLALAGTPNAPQHPTVSVTDDTAGDHVDAEIAGEAVNPGSVMGTDTAVSDLGEELAVDLAIDPVDSPPSSPADTMSEFGEPVETSAFATAPQGQSSDDGQLADESSTSAPNQEVTNDTQIDPAMTPDVEAEVSETTPVTQNANRESMITASTPVSDTSAVADTATTTDPVNLNERGADAKLANAVSQALKGLREGAGPSRISVTLNPEHLGTVQVEIAVRDGSVDIVVSTPSEAARAAVTTLISDIRDMAGETGVGIGGFELSDGRGGTRQPDEGNSDDGTTPHRGQPRSATENADQHRHTIRGNGRVDLHL